MVAKYITDRISSGQQRALEWLPNDGEWRIKAGKIQFGLNSLSNQWPGCVDYEFGHFGEREGMCDRWRLTAKGVEVRALIDELSALRRRAMGSSPVHRERAEGVLASLFQIAVELHSSRAQKLATDALMALSSAGFRLIQRREFDAAND